MRTSTHLFTAALLALSASSTRADDLIPVAIEEVLAQPTDPVFLGVKDLLRPEVLWRVPDLPGVRCLAILDDVTGDGLDDFAVGLGPEVGDTRRLQVRDGTDGALLWSASGGIGFRSLRALAAQGGRLAAAPHAPRGRIAVHATDTGAVLWERELAPGNDAVVSLHSVRWTHDLDADGVPELLVAAGEGRDAAFVLSGADGATLWVHEAGDVVYDLIALADRDADGVPEFATCGGDDTPFLTLLDGVDGGVHWTTPLDGPGSTLLALDDSTGDGVPELAVGQFAAPQSCLLAIDGDDGSQLWSAQSITDGVTDLLLLDDLVGTGLHDIGVGSFDNAISAILAFNGGSQWRRETTTNNGGQVFSIADLGDVDGNGVRDVAGAAMDHQVWHVESSVGQYLARHEARTRCRVIASMGDRTGDGRRELLLASSDGLTLIDGEAGLAGGPLTEVEAPGSPTEELTIVQWALPSTQMRLFASLGTGSTFFPAYGELKLDPSTMITLAFFTAPGAGNAVLVLPPLPAAASGLRIYLQSASVYEPGVFGLFGNVAAFSVP